jgi:hypothetical protein
MRIAADGHGGAHVCNQAVDRAAADVAAIMTVDHPAAWWRVNEQQARARVLAQGCKG